MKSDPSFLSAALLGYESRLAEIERAMADLRRQLKNEPDSGSRPAGRKRTMSAAARRRIAAAQKKRWAAYKKAKAAK